MILQSIFLAIYLLRKLFCMKSLRCHFIDKILAWKKKWNSLWTHTVEEDQNNYKYFFKEWNETPVIAASTKYNKNWKNWFLLRELAEIQYLRTDRVDLNHFSIWKLYLWRNFSKALYTSKHVNSWLWLWPNYARYTHTCVLYPVAEAKLRKNHNCIFIILKSCRANKIRSFQSSEHQLSNSQLHFQVRTAAWIWPCLHVEFFFVIHTLQLCLMFCKRMSILNDCKQVVKHNNDDHKDVGIRENIHVCMCNVHTCDECTLLFYTSHKDSDRYTCKQLYS